MRTASSYRADLAPAVSTVGIITRSRTARRVSLQYLDIGDAEPGDAVYFGARYSRGLQSQHELKVVFQLAADDMMGWRGPAMSSVWDFWKITPTDRSCDTALGVEQ